MPPNLGNVLLPDSTPTPPSGIPGQPLTGILIRKSGRVALYNPLVAFDHQSRILGLDVGSRRIGIAISDPLGITAQGLETLHRKNKKYDLAYLHRLIREHQVQEIVVGLPLRMSGVEGAQAEKIHGFAEDLRKKFKIPVHLWDERLTSAEANRLLRETDLSIEKRGQAVDRMAAILILQSWMEHQAREVPGKDRLEV